MIEGWHNDDYLVLFEGEEIEIMTERYGLRQCLPGHSVVGMRGWDDFIVSDGKDRLFTLPTVPLEPKHLEPLGRQFDRASLKADERFTKKVKWYVKPILFGGDPGSKENITWISLDQHVELVCWWSKLYRDTNTHSA